jgi:hypothetical protein
MLEGMKRIGWMKSAIFFSKLKAVVGINHDVKEET